MYAIRLRNGLVVVGYSLVEAVVKFSKNGVVVAVLCGKRTVVSKK